MTSNRKDAPMRDFFISVRNNYKGYLPEWSDNLLDRFHWLVACGRLLLPNYRFKWPQMGWWEDAWFNNYLEKFQELEGMNADRRWNLGQLMQLTAGVPGDTVECGAYKGAGSYLICWINTREKKEKRHHHVFDSFEGLSSPLAVDGSHWTKHSLAATEDELHASLVGFKGLYTAYKGWIPERFHEVGGKKFSFAHLDLDIYEPTKSSIDFFYPRLNPGGLLLCDDYGFTTCPGATKALDDYLADKPEKMIALSSGGGFLIKGIGGEL